MRSCEIGRRRHASNKSVTVLAVRVGPIQSLLPFSFVLACGGTSTHQDPGGASAGAGAISGASSISAGAGGLSGGAGVDAGGACNEPAGVVPDLAPFEPPPIGALGAYHVTFRNRCAQTVWPAYGPSGGLDESVIDTQLWLPMSPASDRTVTVYGGVREIGFWGRTGCSFDQDGKGSCETGECGGFICPFVLGNFPANATIFDLEGGFQGGYNLGLHVEGASCGSHECSANLESCGEASGVKNACGRTIACSDICSASTACCTRPGCDSGGVAQGDATDDLVVTFCP